MTAEDKEWRDAIACYGYDTTGTPEEVLAKMSHQWQKADYRWRDEITKYLPQLSVMSFAGPQYTIKWLMNHVEIKPAHKELTDKLLAIEASEMSADDKSEARLRSIFPNLGPRIK